jgi:hypothetical protein
MKKLTSIWQAMPLSGKLVTVCVIIAIFALFF